MSARRVLPGGLVAVAAAAAALMIGAPSALAATTDSTWTGASTTSNQWSDAANWDVAPTAPIGNLTFGDLATCDAGTAAAGSSCYSGIDNLGAITANQLTIGGGKIYQVYPSSTADTITLNGNGATPNVGLTAAPAAGNLQLADFGIPVNLAAAQQWNVSGYGILYMNSILGNYPLTLSLNNGYVQANDVETSSVTLNGSGELQLDQYAGSPEKLPAVTVNDSTALAVATNTATSGPINVTGTANNFIVLTDQAPGETQLQVSGNVTLDNTTNVEFDIDGNNTAPGTDVSQLTSSGTVNFNGAQISLWQATNAGNCTTLAPGTTFTVLKAAALTGQIKVGNTLLSPGQSGTETFQSNNCGAVASKTTAIVNYNANSLTATIAGAPTAAGQAPQISGKATVGEKLTVTDNGSWNGAPAPTYKYQWLSCSGSTCTPISGATSSSYVLTSAEAGDMVKVRVTATNDYGSASADSNALGPVAANVTVTSSLRALVRADLSHLSHPRGRRALRLLLRRDFYRTHFSAPAAGTLSVVWRTTIGRGHHRHSYVVARGTAHAGGARSVVITIRLTRAGRILLREHPFNLRVTARERFLVLGSGWTSITRRFTI